jgi:DNA-binding response OmpR family regulator
MERSEGVKKILVVDDRPAIRMLLLEVLKDEFDVKLADCGEEAVREAGTFLPDLILLDVGLPGISGIDALPQLKKIVPGCHIYMLTGSTDNLLIDRAMSLGANGFIEKPFDILKIIDMIKEITL